MQWLGGRGAEARGAGFAQLCAKVWASAMVIVNGLLAQGKGSVGLPAWRGWELLAGEREGKGG